MKVLNVVKYYYPSIGGMETYVRQLCNGMHKQGIESSIITINNIARIETSREVIDQVPVLRVGCQLRLFSQPISLPFGHMMKDLISETDLVHLHCPFPNAEILSNSFTSKPLVVTWCVDPVNTRWRILFPLFRPSLIRVLEMARKIILIGPNLLEHSPTLQPYQHKCDVIPLAYTHVKGAETISTVRKLNRVRPTILFVGKLRKYKGVEHLIRAIKNLPEVLLRVVGNGEELRNLRQLTNKLGIDSRVTFLVDVPNEHLPVEYKKADLFVLPSIDASEAFGIVQAEAMSYGLPVINTNLPSSVPFVSLNGVTGITVPPSDPVALAAAIKKLCDESTFYENCSRNALQRAKLFTEENMIEKHTEVYRECV
jgi:glycosyltransferase involved in cell wall biosynthesis